MTDAERNLIAAARAYRDAFNAYEQIDDFDAAKIDSSLVALADAARSLPDAPPEPAVPVPPSGMWADRQDVRHPDDVPPRKVRTP